MSAILKAIDDALGTDLAAKYEQEQLLAAEAVIAKGLELKHRHMRRLCQLHVRREYLHNYDTYDAIGRLLAALRAFTVRCELRYDYDAYDMIIASYAFEPVATGSIPPTFYLTVDHDQDSSQLIRASLVDFNGKTIAAVDAAKENEPCQT